MQEMKEMTEMVMKVTLIPVPFFQLELLMSSMKIFQEQIAILWQTF